jgi:hypothetical protein
MKSQRQSDTIRVFVTVQYNTTVKVRILSQIVQELYQNETNRQTNTIPEYKLVFIRWIYEYR